MRLIAVMIALGAALALGACGRKAGLDPPPSAALNAPNAQAQASAAAPLGPQVGARPSSTSASAAPAAAPVASGSPDPVDPRFPTGTQPRHKSFILDWLVK